MNITRAHLGKWMYTHTVRKEVAGEMVETRTNVSRQIYDQLLAQVLWMVISAYFYFQLSVAVIGIPGG